MKNELNKLNLEKHRLHENFHNCSYKSIVNEKRECVILMRNILLKRVKNYLLFKDYLNSKVFTIESK